MEHRGIEGGNGKFAVFNVLDTICILFKLGYIFCENKNQPHESVCARQSLEYL